MVPILAGLAIGAALGGGIAALQKKDILQGALMGGIGGALGGALTPAAGVGGAAVGEGVGAAAGSAAPVVNPLAGDVSGILTSAGAPAGTGMANPLAGDVAGIFSQAGAPTAGLPGLAPTDLATKPFSIGSFLGDNKYAVLGGLAGGSIAPAPKPEEPDDGNIQTFGFDRQLNPNRDQPGESYFIDRFNYKGSTPAEDYEPSQFAANGGIVGLADGGIAGYNTLRLGGPQDYRVPELMPAQATTYAPNVRAMAPEVAAYNQQMMERANQQYNINPRPAALQVPGYDRPATNTDTDWLDQQYQKALGRNAELGGRKNWEAALAAGQSKEDIFNKGILGSSEYQQQQANLAAGRKAYINADGSHMYQDLVNTGKFDAGRAPTAAVGPTTKNIPNAPIAGFNDNAGGIDGLSYDARTGRYVGTFKAPSAAGKTDMQKMREELDALKSEKAAVNDTGGAAAGGLMRYAMGGDIGGRYQSPDDMGAGDRIGAHASVNMGPQFPMQGMYQGYAGGGISHLGSYSDGGRLLKGPGDGVSDDIPAQIGAKQPARLADGEFVVPARIVSELGNGSTDAGAKRLYAMMDRVQKNRKKSVGKGKVAVDSKAYKHLPA